MNGRPKLQQQIIDKLIQTHLAHHRSVNLNNQDRKLAIYYLQGGAITTAINVLKLLTKQAGMLGREWRFIIELSRTVEFFDELPDDSRELAAWFRKQAWPERQPVKGHIDSAERQKKSGLSADIFERLDAIERQLNNHLSTFVHPTINSVRYNSHKLTGLFDYQQTYAEDQAEITLYQGVFVAEAISCFLLPINTFPLDQQTYAELLHYKKTLNADFAGPGTE